MSNIFTSPRLIPIYRLLFFSLSFTIICVYIQFLITHKVLNSDFRSFYTAAQIAINDPQQLYNFELQLQRQQQLNPNPEHPLVPPVLPFLNPPLFLVPFISITNLSYQQAYMIAVLTDLILVSASLILLQHIFPIITTNKIITATLIALTFAPVYYTLFLTQSAFLSLIIISCIYLTLKRQQYFITGLLTGILWYKPQIALCLTLYLLLQKHPRLYFGLSIGWLIHLITSLILGINPINYLSSLQWYIQHRESLPENIAFMFSWQGFFKDLTDLIPQTPYQQLSFTTSITTIITTFFIPNFTRHLTLQPIIFTTLICITLLSGFHIHYSEAVLLLFPFWHSLSAQTLSRNQILFISSGWIIFLCTIFSPMYPQPLPFLPTVFTLLIGTISFYHVLTYSKSTSV